jgi:hypothetical protein
VLLCITLASSMFGQCPFNNVPYLDLTPTCPGTNTGLCFWGGDYATVSVTAGNQYIFSTCGDPSFDTQLTLYDNTGFNVLDFNDDFCGLQSQITWTATYSGVVYILLDEYPCLSNLTCITLTVTCLPEGGGNGGGDGCNPNTTICQTGVAGPFTFSIPGPDPVNCLDWFATSQFAYIMLYITQPGALNMLIDGNGATGFLDVAVYNIPNGQAPCDAILNQANLIGCNYAQFSDGCNQFGNSFPCGSSIPSPNVVAGQELMIIVEDWLDGESNTFTLSLGPAPSAQSGTANATILPSGPFCINAAPIQLFAVDMGGLWSGNGVSPEGIFSPAAAGLGSTSISYSIGAGICNTSSSSTVNVFNAPPATPLNGGPYCVGETINLSTLSVPNAAYFWTGPNLFSSGSQNPNILNPQVNASGVYTLTVSVDGCSASGTTNVTVAPAPVSGQIFHD